MTNRQQIISDLKKTQVLVNNELGYIRDTDQYTNDKFYFQIVGCHETTSYVKCMGNEFQFIYNTLASDSKIRKINMEKLALLAERQLHVLSEFSKILKTQLAKMN